MKKLLFSILGVLLIVSQSFAAIPFVQQTILQNAVIAVGNGTELDVRGFSLVNLEIIISAIATVEIEVAQKTGGTYYSLSCVDSSTGTASASTYTTAASNVRCNVAGLGALRARVSARTSGTITVTGTVITVGSVAALGSNIPVGSIIDHAGINIPVGFLLCDGSAISRTMYSTLFTELSTTWGAGDGSTTFNLPALSGRSTYSIGAAVSSAPGVDADVDIVANDLTVASNTTTWITGMPVVFILTSGTITGLASTTTYYVIRESAIKVKLASTLGNAQNNTGIDFTAKSSPIWTITYTGSTRVLGERGGEQAHAQSSVELLAHVHFARNQGMDPGYPPLSEPMAGLGGGYTDSTGGNNAMNIMAPYGVIKKIIKT